ncbi:MAG: O-antigen ligase family protein, partial [Bacteroidota bacterium]
MPKDNLPSMYSFYRRYSKHIYFYGILLLAASLPLSIFTTSLFEIVLFANWILEGNFRKKFRLLKERKSLLLILGLYLLHLVGLLYSDPANFDFAFKDLKIKLPLLILPLILGTSEPLNRKQLKTVLLIFCLATFASTMASFGVFLGMVPYEYYDFRDISLFISHIRLALMVNLSIFFLLYYMFNPRTSQRFSGSVSLFSGLVILWFLFFLVLLKSLTGLIIFGISILVLAWIYSGKIISSVSRNVVRILIIAVPALILFYMYQSVERFYDTEEIEFSELEDRTPYGNRYTHDTTRRARENGHYVWIYLAEDEMESAWNERSDIPYDSLDNKGQEIKYTLIRYLTSKGLKKDRDGVMALSSEDIRAIENGKANYIFTDRYPLYPRIYEVIWEIDGYLRGGDPSGHSVAQRIAYLNAAWFIFKNNPVIGVGTGDVKYSFDQYYEQVESNLDKNYRRRAHNQYVTFFITFGMVGFVLALIFLITPIGLEKAWNDY